MDTSKFLKTHNLSVQQKNRTIRESFGIQLTIYNKAGELVCAVEGHQKDEKYWIISGIRSPAIYRGKKFGAVTLQLFLEYATRNGWWLVPDPTGVSALVYPLFQYWMDHSDEFLSEQLVFDQENFGLRGSSESIFSPIAFLNYQVEELRLSSYPDRYFSNLFWQREDAMIRFLSSPLAKSYQYKPS